LQARLISAVNFGKIKAEVESALDGDLNRSFDFNEAENGWSLIINDLPAGLDRLTVQTEITNAQAPAPVHGLFTVAGDR
jgi:hypothetical protein